MSDKGTKQSVTNIFKYSNILVTNIYSDIRLYQFFFYEYIRTFVRIKFVCTNIFGHSFVRQWTIWHTGQICSLGQMSIKNDTNDYLNMSENFLECWEAFKNVQNPSRLKYSRQLETLQTVGKLTRLSGNFLDCFSVWKIFQTEKSFQTRKNFLDVQKLYCVLCICIIDCTKQACVCT